MSHYRQHASARPALQVFPTVLDSQPLSTAKLSAAAGTKSGAPVDIPESYGDFRRLASFTIPQAPEVQVVKYISMKTGLKVVWAGTPGPSINGYCTVPTEIGDDSGCAHALEQLLGDTLSHIAEQSDGTADAYTTTTNTTYSCTFSTASAYLKALPACLEEILYPELSQDAFDEEVYAIDKRGKEGGNVFEEMQERAGSCDDLIERRGAELVYGERSAFRSNALGALDGLRKLTLKHVEDFHGHAYQPQNLTVTAIGSALTPFQLLSKLSDSIEKRIARHGDARGPHPADWERPWTDSGTANSAPRISRSRKETVPYSSQDDTTGTLLMRWVGPLPDDLLGALAVLVGSSYLTASADAPLRQAFTQRPTRPCSTINIAKDDMDPNTFYLQASDVNLDRLEQLDQEVDLVLRRVAAGPINMQRIESIIKSLKGKISSQLKTEPAAYVFANVECDVLWGAEDGTSLAPTFDDFARFEQLANWPSSRWARFISQYLLAPSIRLLGFPSTPLAKKSTMDQAPAPASGRVLPVLRDPQPLLSKPTPTPIAVPQRVGDFRLLTTSTSTQVTGTQIAKYTSTRTGLKVVWSGTPGPLIHGQFTVPIEAVDDTACARALGQVLLGTLSHLAGFLGGTVDACTTPTNTTYSCALDSTHGFLQALPVYLDGILYPELRQEGIDAARLGAFTLDQVEKFHARTYRPNNLTITVAGSAITPTQLLVKLGDTIEQSINRRGDVERSPSARGRPRSATGRPRPDVEGLAWLSKQTASSILRD